MQNNPKYSESVNAMNGCIAACLRLLGKLFACVIIWYLAPFVGLVFLVWWPVAWILGLIFPGREFFPIKRIWTRMSEWVERFCGLDLESVLLLPLFFIFAAGAIDSIVKLFSGKK